MGLPGFELDLELECSHESSRYGDVRGTRDTGITRFLTSGNDALEDTHLGAGRETEDWVFQPSVREQEKEHLASLAPRHNQLFFCGQCHIGFSQHIVDFSRRPLLASVDDQRIGIVNQPLVVQCF